MLLNHILPNSEVSVNLFYGSSITKRLTGLLFGDKGYIKQELFDDLYAKGLKLVTGIKKGMKNKLVPIFEKVLLRKHSIIESIFAILKYYFELEHKRHRSVWNALVHIMSTLIAYSLKPTKPTIYQSSLIVSQIKVFYLKLGADT